jgi:hypothetical protein
MLSSIGEINDNLLIKLNHNPQNKMPGDLFEPIALTEINYDISFILQHALDDEIIKLILEGRWSIQGYPQYVFIDQKIPIVERILSVATIKDCHLYVPTDDGHNIYDIRQIIDNLSRTCELKILQLMRLHMVELIPIPHSIKAFRFTCKITSNIIDICNWWYEHYGISCYLFDPKIAEEMLTRGNIEILNWYLLVLTTHGIKFAYTSLHLNNNPIDVLNWMVQNNIELIYHNTLFTDYINDSNNPTLESLIKILKWFYDKRDQCVLSYDVSLLAHFRTCDIGLLNWLWDIRHNVEFTYDEGAMTYACMTRSIDVLQWWYDRRHDTPLKYDINCMNSSNIEAWEFFYSHIDELELKYSHEIIHQILYCERVFEKSTRIDDTKHPHSIVTMGGNRSFELMKSKILWWYDKRSVLEFKYDPHLLIYIYEDQIEVFDWWLDTIEFPLALNAHDVNIICIHIPENKLILILKWLLANLSRLSVNDPDTVEELLKSSIDDISSKCTSQKLMFEFSFNHQLINTISTMHTFTQESERHHNYTTFPLGTHKGNPLFSDELISLLVNNMQNNM